ncbi:hypothetical protein BKA83DRAFT_4254081 [Pisolithus microcarpus]|nr:hypothetical protein BKA83DRAFT_4254081 [Pisolithus microcarpus]
MFSYVFSSAPSFWRSPRFLKELTGTEGAQTMTMARCPEKTSPPTALSEASQQPSISHHSSSEDGKRGSAEICEILSSSDLYHILGVPRSRNDATYAFQKVAVAYDVLSKPSSKRKYDSQPPHVQVDDHADNTLKGVLGSVLSDFLDGNLETVHMLLRAVGDLSPSLELSDESIDCVLSVLRGIRERTCRTCVVALHAECIRVLELQSAFRRLPYFDITGRSRLTIQLTRLTITKVSLLIRGIDLVLARVEQVLA